MVAKYLLGKYIMYLGKLGLRQHRAFEYMRSLLVAS